MTFCSVTTRISRYAERMTRSRLAVLALVLISPAAFAQYTNSYGYSFNNPISSTLNQMTWDRINQRLLLRSMLKKKGFTDAQLNAMSIDEMTANLGGSKQAAAESKKLPAPSATKFKPTSKRLLVPALAASLSKVPEQQKVAWARICSRAGNRPCRPTTLSSRHSSRTERPR